jgi:hypothetical protein
MNKHFGGIFNDEHGKTRFAFTNTRLLLEGNEKKKWFEKKITLFFFFLQRALPALAERVQQAGQL